VARGDDFVDEGRPVVRPLLLQDRNKDEVELVEEGFVLLEGFCGFRALEDALDDKVANT
jgi:hypothetical protein